jgi:SAM-dependent MidA family methyltransferase
LPDPDARAHSARVVAAVSDAIAAAGGFLTLERYLALVLYAPGLGYYVSGTAKFGREGDFVTAPELTPLFAGALATQVDAILAATTARRIVELGAGSGALCRVPMPSSSRARRCARASAPRCRRACRRTSSG